MVATVYFWPDSQICSACKNGRGISPDTPQEEGTYICLIACEDNTGGSCSEFAPVNGVARCWRRVMAKKIIDGIKRSGSTIEANAPDLSAIANIHNDLVRMSCVLEQLNWNLLKLSSAHVLRDNLAPAVKEMAEALEEMGYTRIETRNGMVLMTALWGEEV